MLPQQYCLRWKYHHSNLQTMFSQLLDRGCFCDVTLACEGQLIRAHRVVLCACSTFFDTVLTNYASERDPIIIMKDVTFADIKCLIEFMYKGEINVEHANLASLLKTADDLKIKGLAEVTWRDDEDIPPPPTPQTEFHSPTQSRHRDSQNYDSYGHEAQHRSHSPDNEREQKTPSPKHSALATRMPTLTPIPTSAVSIVAASSSPIDSYLGPKRKRGRPPLDDAYDVFNVRKLAHYSDQADSGAYLEGSQYHDEPNNHGTNSMHSRPNSPSAASVVYQQHVQQQKQRLRYRPTRAQQHDDDQMDDESATEPEWITSSLEHENEQKDPLERGEDEEEELHDIIKEENDDNSAVKRPTEKRSKEATTPEHPKMKALKRKSSKEEILQHKSENEDELEPLESTNVPQTVEEIETVQQTTKDKSSSNGTNTTSSTTTNNNSTSSATSSSASSPSTSAAHKSSSSHHHHSHHSHHSHSHSHHSHAPPPLHHPHHYGKYVPEGYLINEHGILMTHDFIHAPTASIPTSSTSASNGHHPDDYVDIKMEEFSEAELRLTTEEMSQWQDVIKMDDYLAKGRRPQFWEEPFTRRVLDAIKNKRLEMKKAARILGVSYGTLYGRYREVYGCLKHPYSSTSLRPSQSSALTVQPRFDIVWPSPKPGQLDIGKLRPKDLSELWTRPQM